MRVSRTYPILQKSLDTTNDNKVLNKYYSLIFNKSSHLKFKKFKKLTLSNEKRISDNTLKNIILKSYALINSYKTNPNIKILDEGVYNFVYNQGLRKSIAKYSPSRDKIVIRRDNPMTIITAGLHECGEREFAKLPMEFLSNYFSSKLSSSGHVRNKLYYDFTHNWALGIQALLTEKIEEDNPVLDGKLREETKRRIENSSYDYFSFARSYIKHDFPVLRKKYFNGF